MKQFEAVDQFITFRTWNDKRQNAKTSAAYPKVKSVNLNKLTRSNASACFNNTQRIFCI